MRIPYGVGRIFYFILFYFCFENGEKNSVFKNIRILWKGAETALQPHCCLKRVHEDVGPGGGAIMGEGRGVGVIMGLMLIEIHQVS